MRPPNWIELDGADNVRDLGGLPTEGGRDVQPSRLIRADSLQSLSDSDVRRLVDDYDVRSVVDLRTGVEVSSEGPGPITREPLVEVVHLSLFPEDEDAAPMDAEGPVVLPWQKRSSTLTDDERKRGASSIYLRYLTDRADSILAALRTIAYSGGATIVHCAAGKDRTGVVVAFALAEVGVSRPAIVDDYAASAERVDRIFDRLSSRRTYATDMSDAVADNDKHKPRAETMATFLETVDEAYGSVAAWVRANGWTEGDAAALRQKLVGPR